MPEVEVLFLVETLKWLERGGRINKAKSLLGSVLSIKPLLRLHEGALEPFQQPRTRSKAIDAMIEWIKGFPDPAAVTLFHDGTSGTHAEVEGIVDRLAASSRGIGSPSRTTARFTPSISVRAALVRSS